MAAGMTGNRSPRWSGRWTWDKLLDTADFYGNGENEVLVSKVLVPNRDRIFIATKFGFSATPEDPFTWTRRRAT
jgi:aryl-alcohol dehydrogenase-like predicted oxidoreductase